MLAIAMAVVASILLALVVCGAGWRDRQRHRSRGRTVRRIYDRRHHADQQVQSAYVSARRAMNDAAGQSWRNLVE